MRSFVIYTVFTALLCLSASQYVFTNYTQPPFGRTGAPGDTPSGCAGSACHSGVPIYADPSTVVMLSLGANNLDNGYTPNTTYSLSLTISDFTKTTFGFQMVALDTAGNQAGSIILINTNSTAITSVFNKDYLSHNDATGVTAWAFNWQAPSTDIGPVNFYIAALAGDGDNTPWGDISYLASYTATTTSFGVSTVMPISGSIAPQTICLGDTATLQATISGGTPPYSFSWVNHPTIEDTNVQNARVYPNTTTTYYLTVTDSLAQIFYDSATVTVYTDSLFTGVITDPFSNLLAGIKVLLIDWDKTNDSLTAVDSAITDAQGRYSFNVSLDSFYLKAIPDSQTYPNLMPTYYNISLAIQYARPVAAPTCTSQVLSTTMILGQNPGGPGFIGGLISQGAGKQSQGPAVGVNLVLVNNNNEPVTYTTTDQNGNFSFDNLALGTYKLWVDQLRINNSLAPQVTLSAGNQQLTNLPYTLEDTVLLEGITNINHIEKSNPIVAYPNPATGSLVLELPNTPSTSTISIYTPQGITLTVKEADAGRTAIDVSTWQPGLYYVQVSNGTSSFTQKVIVQ